MVLGTAQGATSKQYLRQAILASLIAINCVFVVYFSLILLWQPRVLDLISQASSPGALGEGSTTHETVENDQWPSDDNGRFVRRPAFSEPVQNLLRDIHAATVAATERSDGGSLYDYTEREKEKWRRRNSCRARLELPKVFARKGPRNIQRNFEWEAILEAYSALHRACTRNIHNLGLYFSNMSSVPDCKFVTGESLFGLGNRVTHAASVVLYGILTQRVVLFYEWSSWIPAVMCEPFDGSTWKLPSSLKHLNKRNLKPEHVNEQAIMNSTSDFLSWIDVSKAHAEKESHQTFYHVAMDDGWQPVDRFFCDEEQRLLSDVRWISMAGCLYFMPKLFAIPTFRLTLEALFPDRMALTHVLRSIFLPNNVAWDRINRNDEMFFRQADKRVSIQVRYRHGPKEYEKLRDLVNRHTIRCLLENDILPNVSYSKLYDAQNSMFAGQTGGPPQIKQVLITSLYTDLFEILQSMYLRHPTITGESVGFVQLSHEHEQRWGFEADTQALVEIILLSFADEILVTPLSTFGGLAQAYGGVRPWIVEHRDHGNEGGSSLQPCVRASSVDLCYQGASDTMSCPSDRLVHNRKVHELVPHIEKCLAADSPNGVVLITG